MKNNIWFDCKNLTAYRNNFEVVKDLDLKLNKDENIIILGPNGSGKSSIIDIINRTIYPVQKPNSYIRIFNREIIDIWEIRKKISIVNYDIKTRIDGKTLVFDLILSGLYGCYNKVKQRKQDDIKVVKELIDILQIKYISEIQFKNLSEGEKQIALIARALINKPEILILDEPGINLDLRAKLLLKNKINELSMTGTKLLLVTHDLSLITKIYNRIIFLKERKIIADGVQNKIMTSKNINKLFDIEIDLINYNDNWVISKKYN